jgi:predicted Zn-dependent protease
MIRQESGNGLLAEAIDNAQTAYGRGDLKATEAACLEALSIDSSCAPVLSILTQVNIDLGRFDEVLKYARKAVAASPGDPAMHTNLAIVYLNLDQPAEAEKTLLDAIVIDRNFGRAYFYLAALYRQSGRIAEAQMAEQRTAELGYRE